MQHTAGKPEGGGGAGEGGWIYAETSSLIARAENRRVRHFFTNNLKYQVSIEEKQLRELNICGIFFPVHLQRAGWISPGLIVRVVIVFGRPATEKRRSSHSKL
jgi:hypothetical protein